MCLFSLIIYFDRIVNLCEKWEKLLSHGLKTSLSNSTIQNFVTAGLNFTFNIVNVGESKYSDKNIFLKYK